MKHEKKLLLIPAPPCPDIPQPERQENTDYGYTYFIRYTAEIHTVNGENVLGVTTYTVDGAPCHRFWQFGSQCGAEVFAAEKRYGVVSRIPGKMYGASLDYYYPGLNAGGYCSVRTRFCGTDESAMAILHYLDMSGAELFEAVGLLAQYQAKQRRLRIEKRADKERAAMRKEFEGVVPGVPEEVIRFCEDVPLAPYRYFFYTYTGAKEQEGICSYCNQHSTIVGIRNHKMGACPKCGSSVQFYSARQFAASNGIFHCVTAAECELVRGRIVARLFTVGLNLRPDGEGGISKKLWGTERRRSFLTASGDVEATYEAPAPTTKVYVDGLCPGFPNWSWGRYSTAPCNIETLRRALGIYTPLEQIAARGCKLDPTAVWRAARKYPRAEYLAKMGLYRLAAAELTGSSPLREGKTPAELLGVPATALPDLRAVDPTPDALECIRGLLRCGTKVTRQDMTDIVEFGLMWGDSKRIQSMLSFGTAHKALKYIRAQLERTAAFSSASHVLQTWEDYRLMAAQVGKDIDDIHVSFPPALKTAHDEAAKLQRLQKDAKLTADIAKTARRLQDLCWEFDGLLIRPAESREELFQEGETLCHCVGRAGYAEKMAEFKTAIFFVRRQDAADKPYVTLELDLKKWIKMQCYGKHDTWPGAAVDKFVKRWLSEVVKPSRIDKQAKSA